MSRFPIYNKDGARRVIIGPHNLYIAQITDGSKGRKADKTAKPPITHNDPWTARQRPTADLRLAMAQAGIQ